MCPCYVSVRTDTDEDCIVSFWDDGGALLERRAFSAESLRTGENYTAIRKGPFTVSVVKGMETMRMENTHILRCASNTFADALYGWTKSYDTGSSESLLVEGVLTQQHAAVTLIFPSSEPVYPYDVSFYAECDGIDLMDFSAVRGAILVDPLVLDRNNEAHFALSRQRNGEKLWVQLKDRSSGGVLAIVDIASLLDAAGYNWDAEALSDIRLVIDYAKMTITIYVADWEQGKTFVFVI